MSKRSKTPDLRKAAREGRAKMTREGWNADYPDAENFYQTSWGGNAIPGDENYSRFKLAEFDDRYEKSGNFPTAKRATESSAKWKTS